MYCSICQGFPTRREYLKHDTEWRYTSLVGNPRCDCCIALLSNEHVCCNEIAAQCVGYKTLELCLSMFLLLLLDDILPLRLLVGITITFEFSMLCQVSPQLIDVNVLMAVQLLVEASIAASKTLTNHLHQYILFDFRVWSKSAFPVRIGEDSTLVLFWSLSVVVSLSLPVTVWLCFCLFSHGANVHNYGVCVCVFVCLCMCVCVRACVCVCVCECVHACMHTRACVCIFMCLCIFFFDSVYCLY